MNGHPRDEIGTDLSAGRPTVSAAADSLARRIVALMSASEAEKLYNRINYRVVRSAASRDWVLDPTRYLADFDPATAGVIESLLEAEYRRMLRRARARGWEVDESMPPSGDIRER
jgi:hypothetical protein